MPPLKIAHLSDLHLPAPDRVRLPDLVSKRLFSWLSWRRKRRFLHRPEALARIMDDLGRRGVDHVVVTGDLVNLALPAEFEQARTWLEAAAPQDRLTVAPGNHDALVSVPWSRGLGRWAKWMGGGDGEQDFPFVIRRDGVALVGVSSAVPTAPFLASGRIGQAQLARLEAVLAELKAAGLFRIVLVHHPLTDGAVSGRKALEDRAAVRALIGRVGAELVLHGHSHEPAIETIAGPSGPVPVVAAPSASAVAGGRLPPAGWNEIELESRNDAWALRLSLRALNSDGTVSEFRQASFDIPRSS